MSSFIIINYETQFDHRKGNIYMKKFFITGIAACFISASMLLCGCDNTQIQETDTAITSESSVTDVSVISGEILLPDKSDMISDYPVIINDTEIEKAPEKVICLSSSLTEIIYELGFGEKLTGRGSYCCYPENVASLRDFGKPSSPDLDAVIAAKPDLLLTATSIPNKDIAALSDEGIKVLYISSPRSVEEYGRIYCALGMVFEGMHEGEKKGSVIFRQILDKLENTDISLGKFIYITEGGAAAGGDTFESSVLSLYGDNIAKEASDYNFNREKLTDDQPDTVIISNSIDRNEILNDSIYGTLDAVRNGKIINISNSYFESPSGRLTELIQELSVKSSSE